MDICKANSQKSLTLRLETMLAKKKLSSVATEYIP
jgi:hypothetical protein